MTTVAASVADVIDSLELVRAAEIARRCRVARSTVMRWQRPWQRHPDQTVRLAIPIPPPPHVIIGCVEYWSWPLLTRLDPGRFPEDPR